MFRYYYLNVNASLNAVIQHTKAAINSCSWYKICLPPITIYRKNKDFHNTCDLGSSKTFSSGHEGTITAFQTLLVVASTMANADTIPTHDVKLYGK